MNQPPPRSTVALHHPAVKQPSTAKNNNMERHNCTAAELSLVEAVKDALRRRRRPEKNTVCAGVVTSDGQTYLGLDLVSRKTSICAEPAAISSAHFNGSYDIVSIVAVCHTPDLTDIVVISPCGACRELIWYHAPDTRVVLPDTHVVLPDTRVVLPDTHVVLPGDPAPTAVGAGCELFPAGEPFPQRCDASGQAADTTSTAKRGPATDRPRPVRAGPSVELDDEGDPDGYLRARGALQTTETAEILVRRLRDDQ